jgi:HK97 family phage major capsid protein
MNDEIKGLIESQGKAFDEFKKVNDEVQEQVRKLGSADVLLEEKLKKLDESLHKAGEAKDAIEGRLAAEQKRLDELEKRLNRPGMGHNGGPTLEEEVKSFIALTKSHAGIHNKPQPSDMSTEDYELYKKGFSQFLRGGDRAIGDGERKAMMVGSDPDGGWLVQADMSGRIAKRVYETSPIRQIASVQTISTDALEGVNDLDQAADMVMVNEVTAPGETGTPQIGKWRIPVWEGAVEPRATQQLLEDAAVDVEAWLAKKVADRIARGQNRRFVVGSGANEPRGFTSYPTVATNDGARPWGTLEHVGTGTNGAFAAGATQADVLFDLVGAFKDAYLHNARFVTRREVITAVRKFKETTGGYIWQPGLQAGQPQQLLGFPVTIAQDMPSLAAGSLSLAFGDFSEGYQIVDRLGITVIRDNLTTKPYVKFYTRVRFGGAVLNFEAIKFVKFS